MMLSKTPLSALGPCQLVIFDIHNLTVCVCAGVTSLDLGFEFGSCLIFPFAGKGKEGVSFVLNPIAH